MIGATRHRVPLTGRGPTHDAPRSKLTATAFPTVRRVPDASTVWNSTATNPLPTTRSGRIDFWLRLLTDGGVGSRRVRQVRPWSSLVTIRIRPSLATA